jgi:aarF domain-containing kinase
MSSWTVERSGDSGHDRPAEPPSGDRLARVLADLGRRPVPADLPRRLWAIGSVSADIGVGYLVAWLKSWLQGSDSSQAGRDLAAAHRRAAEAMVGTMGYLRGALMKVGQAIAANPQSFPKEFIEALERLHFEAPPMHFALLREHVRNELGGYPEKTFASFETRALAAASLGQVHRGRLESGSAVAVKVQYPGMARSICSDFRSLNALLLPLRLSGDWESVKAQFEDVRRAVEQETDYVAEAASLRRARLLFRGDDKIIVPRIYDEYSSRRVLTMEFLGGVHLVDFLASDPAQSLRDHFGTTLYTALARLLCLGKLLHGDPHPGNFLFQPEGRLGLIDFGCVRLLDDSEWAWHRRTFSAIDSDDAIAVRELVAAGAGESLEPDHMALLVDCWRWVARPLRHVGPFDFGDADFIRQGTQTLSQIAAKRYFRCRPPAFLAIRSAMGALLMLHRLRARVDVRTIWDREHAAAG